MNLRTLEAGELRARPEAFRAMTTEATSDLSLLLQIVGRGEDPIVAALVGEDAGVPVGWAVCERFVTPVRRREYHVLNVFVKESYRRQGLGRRLVSGVLELLPPGVKPKVHGPQAFWARFHNVDLL